ncbi:UNVERIFIED_CONTAM: hypothetical protein HDU68_003770 [Siphonaria sp. JEL0065]|nr:hypothetical protein HDU68_003770 [Siphonaria sp. JEL0065]
MFEKAIFCGGYGTSTIKTIYEDHPDAIAIFGDYLVNIAMYTAAVSTFYKIPYINPAAWSSPLLDRSKYGYAIQMDTMSGMGRGIYLMLKEWNVSRGAIMFPARMTSWATVSREIITELRSRGVSILTILDMNMGITPEGIQYIAKALARVDASLANMNASVGNDYVWIGMNVPVLSTNGTDNNDPDYFKMGRGFIAINGFNNPNGFMVDYETKIVVASNNITVPLGVVVDRDGAWYDNLLPSYDCIMLLAYGFNNLINGRENGLNLLASRSLQHYMNSSLFANTGYRGLDGDPLLISELGDLRSTYNFYSLIGNSSDTGSDNVNFAGTDISHSLNSITCPIFRYSLIVCLCTKFKQCLHM